MEVTTELLSTFPVLQTLPKPALDAIAEQSVVQKFARRGVVLEAGKQEDYMCFLFEGRLQGVDFTIDGREVGLFFVEPGDFCGELGLFDDGPQSEFVIALTASVVVFVRKAAMRATMVTNATILNILGNKLASRVRQMTFQRSLLGLPNIAQRVCWQLWMLVPNRDQTTDDDSQILEEAVIRNPPTHLEIAIMLNTSRETVTRVFQSLQKRQIVRRDGIGKLIVHDPNALKQCAEGLNEL